MYILFIYFLYIRNYIEFNILMKMTSYEFSSSMKAANIKGSVYRKNTYPGISLHETNLLIRYASY